MVHCGAMANKKHDDGMMLEFLRLKYKALLNELNVKVPVNNAAIEVVQEAADEVGKYVQQKTSQVAQENIRELRGLVLEFQDWCC